ncbi:MAG: DUF177 domain-containing protein [Chloroflexi bacterium]|nr:DUF177 domain-containing protein [Chloroflexota bacterium]
MADYIFNVARVLAQTSGPSRAVDVHAPARVLGVSELSGPVRGTARITRLSDAVLVTGQMRASASVSCARCMDDVEIELAFELDDQFVPRIDPVRGGVVDPGDRWPLDPGHNLDLSQVLAEGAISALPPRVLCAGPCEAPGSGPAASRPAVDPRLAPLERLRRQMLHKSDQSHG